MQTKYALDPQECIRLTDKALTGAPLSPIEALQVALWVFDYPAEKVATAKEWNAIRSALTDTVMAARGASTVLDIAPPERMPFVLTAHLHEQWRQLVEAAKVVSSTADLSQTFHHREMLKHRANMMARAHDSTYLSEDWARWAMAEVGK